MNEYIVTESNLGEGRTAEKAGDIRWLFIRPQDVWMFRDNKPFGAQQNFVARSLFPPNPQTMQGAIRTLYMEQTGVDWKAFARGGAGDVYAVVGRGARSGDGGVRGSLQVFGPYVATRTHERVEFLVRAPQDLLFKGDGGGSPEAPSGMFAPLAVADRLDFSTNLPFDGWRPLTAMKRFSREEGAAPADGWLTQEQLALYLKGELFHGILRRRVFEVEGRVGLGMEYGRRAHQEGLLYNAHFIRPHEDVGLLVGMQPRLFAESGSIRIGGESRSSHFTTVENVDLPAVATGIRYKIVLLTPAYFREGTLPTHGNWEPWVGSGKLVSAAIERPLAISGWNLAFNKPRPLRHYVPAGSVYYFEGGGFTGKPFTETPQGVPDFAAMGYGSVAIGNW